MVRKAVVRSWVLNLLSICLLVLFMFVVRFIAIEVKEAYDETERTPRENLSLLEKGILNIDEEILSCICSTLLTTSSKDAYNKEVLLVVDNLLLERNEYVLKYNFLFSFCFPDSSSPYTELSFIQLPWENSIFSADIRRSRRLQLVAAKG